MRTIKTKTLPGAHIPLRKRGETQKEWSQIGWTKLVDRLSRAASARKLSYFLEIGMSENEKSMLLKRITALDRLSEGMTYRGISNELSLSQQTISSIKKALVSNSFTSYGQYSKTTRKKKVYASSGQISGGQRDPLKHGHKTKYGTVYY